MNQIHVQTVLASNGARVAAAGRGKRVFDFGARRTHGIDAALLAARAFYIAGIDATSNVLASNEGRTKLSRHKPILPGRKQVFRQEKMEWLWPTSLREPEVQPLRSNFRLRQLRAGRFLGFLAKPFEIGAHHRDLSLQAARRGAQCIDGRFGIPEALFRPGVSDLSTHILIRLC